MKIFKCGECPAEGICREAHTHNGGSSCINFHQAMVEKFTSYNKQSAPCSRCGELNNSRALYCQWCGFTGRE